MTRMGRNMMTRKTRTRVPMRRATKKRTKKRMTMMTTKTTETREEARRRTVTKRLADS